MVNYQDEHSVNHRVAEPIAEYGIPAGIKGLWSDIQALSPANRQWIRDHLMEQEYNDEIELISDAELATCISVEEMGQRLRAMVHEHFQNRVL